MATPPWLSISHSAWPGGSLGSKVLTVKLRSRPTMAAVSRCEAELLQLVDLLEHPLAPQALPVDPQETQRGQAQRDGHRVGVDDVQLRVARA